MIHIAKLKSDNKLEKENWFFLMEHIFTDQKLLQLQRERGRTSQRMCQETNPLHLLFSRYKDESLQSKYSIDQGIHSNRMMGSTLQNMMIN